MTTFWAFDADSSRCTIYGREPSVETPIFETFKFNFEQALHLAEAFDKVYRQGIERGMSNVAAETRATLDRLVPV
jgi:hypothetical protein